MLLETFILSGALIAGYKSWRNQDKNHNHDILAKQRQSNQCHQKTEKDHKSLETQQHSHSQKLSSLSAALVLSAGGYLLYAPLAYLSIPFILYAEKNHFFASWRLLKQKRIDIDTLVIITILGAIIGKRFFIASLLSTFAKVSDYLTSQVTNESRHELVNIFQQAPAKVWLLKDNIEIHIDLSEVKAGDILVVSAGEIIPADGNVIWGMAGIDQHQLTGEAIPVEKSKGDEVFAMTMVLSGKIHIRVDKAGAESSAAKIANILNNTADYKSLTALRAETFSRQLINPALITSAVAWPLLGFSAAVAVLFIHPKNRLSVSAPISLLKYLKHASERSILIKDGRSLELLNQVDTIVFDKTGTLTDEQPHIGTIHSFSDYAEHDILRFAAIAEHKQTHPLARAILAEAEQRELLINTPEHSEYRMGYGVKVTLKDQVILIGSLRFMDIENIVVPELAQNIQETSREQGHGLIIVALNNQLIGAIELLPSIRPEAKSVIQQLKQRKQIKKTYIISGDGEAPTQRIAQELGIDHYFAQTLPQEKAGLIEKLQQEGAFVCYVGDGINDAIAMKQAQVSVSLSGASQLATDTAQIVLLDQGIKHLPLMFEIQKGFHSHMNNQVKMVLSTAVFGVSGIFIAGWGMSMIITLNIFTLLVSVGYSFVDRPKVELKNKSV